MAFWYQWVIASPLLGKWIVSRTGFERHLLQWGFVNEALTEEEITAHTDRLKEPARAYASVLLYGTFLLREVIPLIIGRYWSSRLSTPSLILFGEHDLALSPALLKGYDHYADDLEIEFVPNSGHSIVEDQPELVTRRALEFFALSPWQRRPTLWLEEIGAGAEMGVERTQDSEFFGGVVTHTHPQCGGPAER